ncbi:MAG: hypothetical protein LBG70_03135, partial [Bifidobacteriaceae bacterium]|nr:hypothetical protein [Bifidobacteriaceae bacterium]
IVYANDDASQAEVTAVQTSLIAAIARAKLRQTSSPVLAAALASQAAGAPLPVSAQVPTLARPKIKGQAKVGAKLQAKVTGLAKGLRYQWYRGARAIKGATKATYRLRAADQGKRISVRVLRAGVSRTSAASQKVR